MNALIFTADRKIRGKVVLALNSKKEVKNYTFYDSIPTNTDEIKKQNSQILIIDEELLTASSSVYDFLFEGETPTTMVIHRTSHTYNSKIPIAKENLHSHVGVNEFSKSFMELFVDFGAAREQIKSLISESETTIKKYADLTHEIRNPLAIISAKCEKMKKALLGQSIHDPFVIELQNTFTKISNMSLRMKGLTEELFQLSMGHSFTEESDTSIKKVLLIDLIWSAIDDTRDLLNENSVLVRENIHPEFYIHCNNDAFIRAIGNLIKNACDAVKNLPERWIQINSEKRGIDLIIEVIDSGTGIKNPEKVFESKYTTKGHMGGKGLGLGIVKNYFNSIGGSINYCLKNGHTCFEITITNAFKESSPQTDWD